LSPLSSEETVSTSAQHFADPGQVHERRLHPRIFPKTLVYVACGAANGGMVLNASDAGMAISMAIAVGGDSFSNVLVRMNGLPQAIEANGRIVWTNVSRKRAGIQFLEVNDTQRAKIWEWLAYEGVREVHLVPQDAPKIVAPVAPVFDESRYSLLQAFGGSAPEFLGPVPSLVDQLPDQHETLSSSANAEMQPVQDFTGEAQTAFRDNEWDLADVTLIPRKKTPRTGFPARALIILWIAIPCLGVGMLVGRRPLDQWLARGNANGENISQAVTRVAEPVAGNTPSALNTNVEASPARPSAQDAALTRVHVDATNYPVADSTAASPLPQNTSATLLNSLSTQELRAVKRPSVAVAAPPPQPPAIRYPETTNSKPPSASSFQPAKPAAVPAPAATASAVAAAPLRKPDISATALSRDVQPADSAGNGPAQQNYDERMPRTLSVDSGLAPRSTMKIPTPGNAQPAPMSPAPTAAMTARSNSAASTPPSGARSLASSPNPAPARAVSPGGAPSIAPVLPQPPLHGVIRVARKNDESFLLKLPLESVATDHNTSIRMQRFVMVPKESRWRRHGPIVKLNIGELLDHDAPEIPRAMNTGDVITVRAFIDKNGAVQDLKPVSGRFALLPRVMRAVRDWQFDQTLLDGKPVESEVNVTMEFRPAH
jgi:PilZ domain